MNALSELARAPVSAAQATIDALDRDGFAIARGAAEPGLIRAISADLDPHFDETDFSVGPFYGDRTVRFGRLLARSARTADLLTAPDVLDAAEAILGRSHAAMHLSFTQAIAVHPGSPAQVPHRDEDMWPCIKGDAEYLINVIWPLDRFTAANGATLVWPGSHRGGPGAGETPEVAEMEPGDALIFMGSTQHCAGANRTVGVRRALVFGYSAAWLTPSENPILACPPELARTLPAQVQALAGYRRYAPNINNYDCRCPSELLTGAPAGGGAIDQLHPWQEAALKQLDQARRDAAKEAA